MSVKYKFRAQSKLYLVSFAVVYWIDIFIRNEYKDILLESIRFCQKEKGLEVYAWCLMTSHVHLILELAQKLRISFSLLLRAKVGKTLLKF